MLQPPKDAPLDSSGQIKNESQVVARIPKYIDEWLEMRAKTLKTTKSQQIRKALDLLLEREAL